MSAPRVLATVEGAPTTTEGDIPMAETVNAALTHEHQQIDGAIEVLLSDHSGELTQQQLLDLDAAIALLRRHIYIEEESLFPPLRDAGLVGPVMVMVHEHGQIWPLLDALQQQLSTGAVGEARTTAQALTTLLAAHNMKEEHILYPQADELLAAERADALVDWLVDGRMPEGWICQGVPQR